MAYCIAIVLMFLEVFLMVTIGILKLVSSDFIDGMCAVALAPALMTIRGSVFHPLAAILAISGMYLLFFASIVSGENLSLQYVNSRLVPHVKLYNWYSIHFWFYWYTFEQ